MRFSFFNPPSSISYSPSYRFISFIEDTKLAVGFGGVRQYVE